MLYYTKTDEYVKVDDDIATIGITNYAQEQLGDIIFIDAVATGKNLEKGGILTAIESVKAATDVYSPVSGEVVGFNDALSTEPGIVNQSAQEDGWIVKVKLSNLSELDELLTEEDYSKIHAE